MSALISVDPKIRFIITVPDGLPEEATPFQGFAFSLCNNSNFLRSIQRFPSNIYELTPSVFNYRIAQRIAGLAPINWYGQSPNALKFHKFPIEASFTFIIIDGSERAADYEAWIAASPGPVTIIANDGTGHIRHSELSFSTLRARLLQVCELLIAKGTIDNAEDAKKAISSWIEPKERNFPYEIGGHGTIAPNAAVLTICGYAGIGYKPYSRHLEGEKAHLEQIVLTTNAIFDEREANPPSLANRIYPRSPDLNLYCPATYELKSAISINSSLDRDMRRKLETVIRVIDKQNSYSYTDLSSAQGEAILGVTIKPLFDVLKPKSNVVMQARQLEIWLGTEAVGCLAASDIGAVVRLPNRLNLSRGIVRQFAQHYRSDRQQTHKRVELFRGVQRAIAEGVPVDLQNLINRSRDGIRIIADAHIEWLDVRGIPLGLRYNVSRIPVTPGNAFIQALSSLPRLYLTPEDFRDVLVISGLDKSDAIAHQFDEAFEVFGKQWRDKLNIKFVRVRSRRELVNAINDFDGVMMVFDGHGSHKPDQPGVLWLGSESVDVWTLRGEIKRPPPIVVLSACDTHAADRNHATVANGFMTLGCRSVLGSVFPLHAAHAAVFAARLLYRVSHYIPAAIDQFRRSLTWLEIVSGMLRRQLLTDILMHLGSKGLIKEDRLSDVMQKAQFILELESVDPFAAVRKFLIEEDIPMRELDDGTYRAVAASSAISYLHIGRPETILINTVENLEKLSGIEGGVV